MKPFTLQAALDYRKRLEDQAKNRLFQARQTENSVIEKLASETKIYQGTITALEDKQQEGMEIGELIRYQTRLDQLKNNIDAIKINLLEKQEIVKQEREHLLNKSREHKIMQRFKEEKNNAWRAYLDKKEAAILDEIGVMRHDTTTSKN